MTAAVPLLSAHAVGKVYGAPVLRDVDLVLRAGEVHALVGENGAGKSTLSRILSGITRPDAGTMRLRGEAYAPTRKADAEARGVGIVLQELNVIETLTVAEQLQLGRFPRRAGLIDRRTLVARARRLLERVGLATLDPRRHVASLGAGERQLVVVAAELARAHDVLILDEPTAALSERQAELLLDQVDRLRAAGRAIVYISHRLEEVLRIADRVTVLRDGLVVATRQRAETSSNELVALMVGRAAPEPARLPHAEPGEVILRVSGLSRPPAVRDVSFDLRRGEILGLAGLMGAGRTETVRALCGADRARDGRIWLDGRPLPRPLGSPREAVRHGLALVTEKRQEEGLLLPMGIRHNVTITTLSSFARLGFLRQVKEAEAARLWVERLSIRGVRSLDQPVTWLSGGNQQKVVLAKWLLRRPRILVCDEPTRGIDVGARAEIHRLLRVVAGEGGAVLVVSSEIEELFELCDRIVVLSLGRVAGTFARGAWSREAVLTAALRYHDRPAAGVRNT